VSLLGTVTRHLRERETPFALIGAAAMAVHGVSRATRDLDLLVLDRRCLEPAYWEALSTGGVIQVDLRRGDAEDPLGGIVRLRDADGATLDLVVGKSRWQGEILTRAREVRVEDTSVPVARRADLILLKLYAGGHQDAWDIEQLLLGPERPALVAAVERELPALPDESRRLWARIARPGGGPAA
jgi:predicted nucleotidyltransferase